MKKILPTLCVCSLLALSTALCTATFSSANSLQNAQMSLQNMGYNPGTTDGKMGQQTQKAIRHFQKDNNLPQSGKMDRATQQMLNSKASHGGREKQSSSFQPVSQGPHHTATPAAPASHPTPTLANAQRKLAQLGYHPGPADGQAGKNTENALRQFQKDHHLPVTGSLDQQTRSALQGSAPR